VSELNNSFLHFSSHVPFVGEEERASLWFSLMVVPRCLSSYWQVSSSKIRVSFAGSRQDQLVIGLADPLFIS
jgi:hypothetical protein